MTTTAKTSAGDAAEATQAQRKAVNLARSSIIFNSSLAQEIKVPLVAQLARWGVRFVPAAEGVAGIAFDAAAATLSLPVVTLDGSTEVVLRNLVAYEAVAVRGPLVLARYTELMYGIVDTARDVKILRAYPCKSRFGLLED